MTNHKNSKNSAEQANRGAEAVASETRQALMRCFTWSCGKVHDGLAITQDETFGPVVFLGEEGRGRRYEKVSLDRRRPPYISDGRLYEAQPREIMLPAKGNKLEKSFYVLEEPREGSDAVLLRINTRWTYTKNSSGSWATVEGKPKTLTTGYGARGIAGRIGNWDDGLVEMRPGDVLKVKPEGGHKTSSYALWIDENKQPQTMTWKDYENVQAVEKAQAMIEQAENSPEALNLLCGQMSAFTWDGGQITKGLQVSEGATGLVVSLGETGRGRSWVEIPMVGMDTTTVSDSYGRERQIVESASVAILSEKTVKSAYTWVEPTTKRIHGLTNSEKTEEGALVRVSTSGPYTKNSSGQIEPWKGSPQVITSGSGAHGAAGRVGGWSDALLSLKEGDVLYVRQEGGYKSEGPWALFVENGELQSEIWHEWKAKDAQRDPDFYIEKGTAPIGHVPTEWKGQVVTVRSLSKGHSGCGPEKAYIEDCATGELVNIEQDTFVLNMGWDGRDYQEKRVSGQWVKLEKNKTVHHLEGEEAEKRRATKAKAEALKAKATQLTQQSCFSLANEDVQAKVRRISEETELATMPTENDPYIYSESLVSWSEKAERVLGDYEQALSKLQSLEERQEAGEIIVNFGGHFRRMGNSGNGDYWVIQADGTLREADSISYRKRYNSEGDKQWNIVEAEELALEWDCSTMNDIAGSSTFKVAKAPVDQCTPAQLEAIARIEQEIGAPQNAFGLNAEIVKVYERRMKAIKQTMLKSEMLREVPEDINYMEVAGNWGFRVYLENIKGRVESYTNWNAGFTERCENRDAQVIYRDLCDDGVLEFLAYEKWGDTNLNIRFRELTEEEQKKGEVTSSKASTSSRSLEGEGMSIMAAALTGLKPDDKKDKPKKKPAPKKVVATHPEALQEAEKMTEELRTELRQVLNLSAVFLSDVKRSPLPDKHQKKVQQAQKKLNELKALGAELTDSDSAPSMRGKADSTYSGAKKLAKDTAHALGHNKDWPETYEVMLNDHIPTIEADYEGKISAEGLKEIRAKLIEIAKRNSLEDVKGAIEELVADKLQ